MEKKKKLMAAALSLTLVFGAAGTQLIKNCSSNPLITAQASAEDTASDGYIEVDESTGVMTMHGHITKELIHSYRSNKNITGIVAAQDCVLPADCSYLFYKHWNAPVDSGHCTEWYATPPMDNSDPSSNDSGETISSLDINAGASNDDYEGPSFENLQSIDISNADTSGVTNMSHMFDFGYNSDDRHNDLTTINVSGINTSNVTDMSYMFTRCRYVKQLDLSSFDTSKVTNMSGMFSSCFNLTSLDVTGFNTTKVEDMSSMFYSCSGLTSLDVTNFNTSRVKDMDSMFESCSGLTSLDVTNFNTSRVIDMDSMFEFCSGLTSLDVTGFDTSKVEDMGSMFYSCSGLTSLDVTGFDTSRGKNMSYMFGSCSGLTSLDVTNFNTLKLKDTQSMFKNCEKLTSIDLSNFDLPNIKQIDHMFESCKALKTIYASKDWYIKSSIYSKSMFKDCTSLVGGNGTEFNQNKTMGDYARIDKDGLPGYFTDIADKPEGGKGDVNADGIIDVVDAVAVINHVNGVKSLSDNQIKSADIDGSGNIDIEDAVAIIMHVNGEKPII